MKTKHSEREWKQAVKDGGGIWCGMCEGLVYFNSPQTNSTLVLKETDTCSAARVAMRISVSNAQFKKEPPSDKQVFAR